jgi:hypothetical protein
MFENEEQASSPGLHIGLGDLRARLGDLRARPGERLGIDILNELLREPSLLFLFLSLFSDPPVLPPPPYSPTLMGGSSTENE